MSGKMGLLLGLAAGLLLAIGSSVTTLIVIGAKVKERESAAYDKGMEAGQAAIKIPPQDISKELNQAVLNENRARAEHAAAAREKLKTLTARTDLPPEAQTLAKAALDALGQD